MEGVWPALLITAQGSESVISKSVISPNGSPSNTDSLNTDLLIAPPRYGRTNPFPARLITNRKLNAPWFRQGHAHFEISLEVPA